MKNLKKVVAARLAGAIVLAGLGEAPLPKGWWVWVENGSPIRYPGPAAREAVEQAFACISTSQETKDHLLNNPLWVRDVCLLALKRAGEAHRTAFRDYHRYGGGTTFEEAEVEQFDL